MLLLQLRLYLQLRVMSAAVRGVDAARRGMDGLLINIMNGPKPSLHSRGAVFCCCVTDNLLFHSLHSFPFTLLALVS